MATEDEALVAVELYARARLMLAFAALASPPARKSSPAAPKAPSEAGEETVVATTVADAEACAAASARAADEAEASLRAWSVLFKPLLNADILHAEKLRRVLPDACRSVSAALRCAKMLWYLLRDGWQTRRLFLLPPLAQPRPRQRVTLRRRPKAKVV